MTMTPRRRRMVLVGLILVGVSAAAAFALTAFQDNLLYYYPPSDVAAGKAPVDRGGRSRPASGPQGAAGLPGAQGEPGADEDGRRPQHKRRQGQQARNRQDDGAQPD